MDNFADTIRQYDRFSRSPRIADLVRDTKIHLDGERQSTYGFSEIECMVYFPEKFLWGTATASYQVEGAVDEDGRGETIWDRFCHTPGKIRNGDTGDTACDHYRRFKEDISLMKELEFRAYRFSVAWSRIFPRGGGSLNRMGMDFYQHLVDELLKASIEPVVTVYHWDLPQVLQDRGGWANRDTIEYYTDYAATLFEKLGDRVKTWITHNESAVAAFVGHGKGKHAPGLEDFSLALNVAHNLLVSHAKGIRIFREIQKPESRIGIALDLHPIYRADDNPEDIQAAQRADEYMNRWFLDPVFIGKYPENMAQYHRNRYEAPTFQPGDEELLKEVSIDFLGVNYYFRQIVKASRITDRLFDIHRSEDSPRTEMGWEIYPEGLYELLMRLRRDYDNPEIIITENGAACKDETFHNGKIEDDDRIDYLREHFFQAHRAIQDGVRLSGYLVWSLMDNFEWAHGYGKRFGLLHVNHETQERTLKKSAEWYRQVIRENGLEAD